MIIFPKQKISVVSCYKRSKKMQIEYSVPKQKKLHQLVVSVPYSVPSHCILNISACLGK